MNGCSTAHHADAISSNVGGEEEAEEIMSRHLHPPTDSNTEKSSWRRTPSHSSWSLSLGILIVLIGGMGLLYSTSSNEGGSVGRWRSKIMTMSGNGIGDDSEKIKVARYGNTTTIGRGRLFRNSDVNNMNVNAGSEIKVIQEGRAFAPTPESKYERIWPGYRLPWWAGKVRRFRDFEPPAENSMCFVHVGKTAGSSVGCALGFRLHCKDNRQWLRGRLPKSVTHVFHKDVYDCPASTAFYLLVVRDPLARIRSAFVYGRPDEKGFSKEQKHIESIEQLYVDCPSFSTMNELALSGLAAGGEASDECKQRARDLLRGTARFEDHAYYNYQYYMEAIPRESNFLVIRTEHIEEDWNEIERGLDGRERSIVTFPHENSRPKEDRDLILGDEERILLCHELCAEIQTYKLMLQGALNIDETQYNTTMGELQASCPKEAMLEKCDFHTPNIKEKLITDRGYEKFAH